MFPTGRAWARDLDYPSDLLARVPETSCESFAGVANPFSLGVLDPGEDVLDVGCGAGMDSLVAAQMVGPAGSVTGIDMTPDMAAKARRSAVEMGVGHVTIVDGSAEELPFGDASFDVVISNGVIDLIPDKDAVFAGLMRVLRPGGRIQLADVTIQRPVSRRAGATSISGPAELPGLCWKQREPPAAPRLHRHLHRCPDRRLRPVGVRGHAPQGREVRGPGNDGEGVQARSSLRRTATGRTTRVSRTW